VLTSDNVGAWLTWPATRLFGEPAELVSNAGTIAGALGLTGFHVFNVGGLYLLSAWALRERPDAK